MSFLKKVKSLSSAPAIKRPSAANFTNYVNKIQSRSLFSSQKSNVLVENEENNRDHSLHGQKTPITWDKAKTIIKQTLLVACWIFFTVIFFVFDEKENVFKDCVVEPGKTKGKGKQKLKFSTIAAVKMWMVVDFAYALNYYIREQDYTLNLPKNPLTLRVDLRGPVLSELEEKKLTQKEQESRSKVEVWLERRMKSDDVNGEKFAEPVSFLLLDTDELAFSEGNRRSARFEHQSKLDNSAVYVIRISTTAPVPIPLSINYQVDPISTTCGIIYACLLLCLLYILIIFEIINRTLAAIFLSTLSLAVLSLVGERPSIKEIVSWLDEETLLLLLSMMILVAIMAETGMFDFLAVFTFQVTKGKMWPLINLLCIITAVLSTCLDNVTTVLLISPVTIKLCEVMGLQPIPVLTAMVLFSNIGGSATPVGDPPNVIIASNKIVRESGIHFANFTLHMTAGVILVCVQAYIQLRYLMYRDVTKLRLSEPREIQDDLEAGKDKDNQKDAIGTENDDVVPTTSDKFQRTLANLKEKYKIHDKNLLIKSCVAIGFVVTIFFLHAFPEFNRVSLGWTALLGAILLLILAGRENIESILDRVEWSTLLFFASLFVFMEALTILGLIEYIGRHTETIIMAVDESHRLAVALLLILWISGMSSAFVDNIPLTTMMVRVVTSLGTNPSLALPLPPLIWALSFGACLGGNGTLIGASANVVCAGVAEQHGYKITFMEFFKVGFPLMIGHLIVVSLYLLICHCMFTWH